MSQTIGYIALLVRDYNGAIAFYTEKLDFTLVEDKPVENKRGVLVAGVGGASGGGGVLMAIIGVIGK